MSQILSYHTDIGGLRAFAMLAVVFPRFATPFIRARDVFGAVCSSLIAKFVLGKARL